MVTLKKIADELGISQMTVSRALRGVSQINPETRRLVRQAAARMGYEPMTAVMMPPAVRAGGDQALRILLPTVCHRIGAEAGSWYLDRMVAGMRSRLERSNGWFVEQHFQTIDDLLMEYKHARFHGVVLRQPLPNQWVKRLLEIAAVVYAVEFDHQLDVDSVYSNEHRSAAMILDHLASFGHRHIAWFGILDRNAPYWVVSDAMEDASAADRQAVSVHGARHAAWANIAQYQLIGHHHPVVLVERDWTKMDLEAAVEEGLTKILAMSPRPTAIVCSCDPVALLTVEQLQKRGLKIPADISVVAYGGCDDMKNHKPAITSVEMPMETIGRVIPELIERRLADPEAAPISVQFQTTLFKGETVAKATGSSSA